VKFDHLNSSVSAVNCDAGFVFCQFIDKAVQLIDSAIKRFNFK
jgi:hypothetical protein